MISSILFALSLLNPTLTDAQAADTAKGMIKVDGSSTVFPITEAVAEEFQNKNRNVQVTVGTSGTGGGFKKFLAGETDINDASRPISPDEAKLAKANKVSYVEFEVAYDGITVVVNKNNKWVDSLSVAELKKLWESGSKVMTWKDLRPNWPDRKIHLYGPGTDSGTFDYFTEVINGKAKSSRADFSKSEDDNMLVNGVAGDVDSLAYFGYAYYFENQEKLRAIPIGEGKQAVLPSEESIHSLKYKPLSRPVYIYVSSTALKRPEVKSFVEFYLESAGSLVSEVGYIPLAKTEYQKGLIKLKELIASNR